MTLKTFTAALVALFLLGCPSSPGKLAETGLSHDFGAVLMGQVAEQQLSIRNAGGSPLTLTSLESVDGDAAVFEVEFRAGTIVPPGATASLVARFTAPVTDVGAVYMRTLRLKTDGGDATLTLTARTVASACALPVQLDYGVVPVGGTSRLELELKNPLGQAVTATIGALYSSAGAHAAFAFAGDSAQGTFEIPAQSSRVLAVEFRPTEPGNYLAFVRLQPSGQCEEHVLALTGSAATQVLSWEPTTLDCGYVTPGVKATRDITFQNLMSAPLHLSQLKTLNLTDFGIESTGSADLTRLTVPAATPSGPGEATLTVYCKPAALGPRQTTLTFQTGLPGQPSGSVSMKVFGGGPDIEVQPYPVLDFGKVAYFASGTSTSVRTLRVLNVGTGPATQDPAANLRLGAGAAGPLFRLTPLNANTTEGEFAVTIPSTYDPATGLEARVGANAVELRVRVEPTSAALKEAKLEIFSNDPDEPVVEVTLSANAVALPPCDYSVSEATLAFGLISAPDYRERTFTIRNNGTSAGDVCLLSGLALTGTSSIFSLPSAPLQSYELAPGEELLITVRAWPQGSTPTTITNATGQVGFYISSDTRPQGAVSLSAQLGESCLTLAPNEYDFGAVKLGCASAIRTFRLYGSCANPVVVTSVALLCQGAPCTEFSLPQPPTIPTGGASLAPADAPLTLQLQYQPTAAGKHTAVLAVSAVQGTSNVSYVLPLSGRADGQGLHQQRYQLPANPKADVLLVIDNSGGMDDDQVMLGNNFTAFVQYAQANQVDYRIAVTTSDPTNGGRFVTGTAHPEKILTPTTSGLATKFYNKVWQGGLGSGTEMEAEPALRALTPPLALTDNAGFLCRDASLAIVALTDEPDQSPHTTTYYLDHFWNLKSHQRREQFTFSAITGFTSACPTDDGKLASYADATGGVKMNLCTNDWPGDLAKVGKIAFGFKDTFFLDAVPDTTATPIEVKVDGVVMPQVSSIGVQVWTWDAIANAVAFAESYAPEAGQTLELRYQTTCY